MIYEDLLIGPFAESRRAIKAIAENFYFKHLLLEAIEKESTLANEAKAAIRDGDILLAEQKQSEIQISKDMLEITLGVHTYIQGEPES